jgi:hypothetical protein
MKLWSDRCEAEPWRMQRPEGGIADHVWGLEGIAEPITSADGGWRVPFEFAVQWPAAVEFSR